QPGGTAGPLATTSPCTTVTAACGQTAPAVPASSTALAGGTSVTCEQVSVSPYVGQTLSPSPAQRRTSSAEAGAPPTRIARSVRSGSGPPATSSRGSIVGTTDIRGGRSASIASRTPASPSR